MPRLNFTEKRAIPEDTLLAWPRNFDKSIFLWLSNLQYFLLAMDFIRQNVSLLKESKLLKSETEVFPCTTILNQK